MPMTSVPSFQTLDHAHYIATGEHLPHREGDKAPHPLEYHIKKTVRRQHRARLWELLDDSLSHEDADIKPASINGVWFTKAIRIAEQIHLFDEKDKPVMILTSDGEDPAETDMEIESEPIALQSPWLNDESHPCFEDKELDPCFMAVLWSSVSVVAITCVTAALVNLK